jgi:hypothetical protein
MMENLLNHNKIKVFLLDAVQIDKIALTVIATILFPILIHLLPFNTQIPIGAIWIPVFYAPFIACLFYRPHVAVIAGICSPLINIILTSRPFQDVTLMLMLELVFFALIATLLLKKIRWFSLISVVSYIAAKFISAVVLGITPHFAGSSGLTFWVNSIINALPGLVMLAFINIIVVSYERKKKLLK